MFVAAVAEFFKYKLANSVIILACWNSLASLRLSRELTHHGIISIVSCNSTILTQVNNIHFQGVLVFSAGNNSFLEKVKTKQFANWYKWLVVGDEVPKAFKNARYDVDLKLLRYTTSSVNNYIQTTTSSTIIQKKTIIEIQDAYIHPRDGISLHPWAVWTEDTGLMVSSKYEHERIRRREDLMMYPLSIIAPIGTYTPESYKKSFKDYLKDITTPEKDSSIRIGYAMASLMVEALNATEVLRDCLIWNDENHNASMLKIVSIGEGDITGAILRLLPRRVMIMDPVTYLWPLSAGFLYLADRDSSSNMFVKPFTPGLWLCCLGIGIVLALAQRVTAKRPMEIETAYMDVLATWLQQDASAAPDGPSGRWTFIVMSLSAMLVHAYYTSSIVSALMSAGTNGPKNLRELTDSRYNLASEDYQWMKIIFFEENSGWDDMEYLKRRKKNSKFYQEPDVGMELVRQGGTAFHADYNHVYPRLNTFSDEQICKLDKVDTIPEMITWLVTTKQGQWTEIFRITATWIHETGLSQRLLFQIQVRPPECRASLLAERVKLGDILPLLGLTLAGALLSLLLLVLEILFAKWKKTQLMKARVVLGT